VVFVSQVKQNKEIKKGERAVPRTDEDEATIQWINRKRPTRTTKIVPTAGRVGPS
jgi:hypothetical protein